MTSTAAVSVPPTIVEALRTASARTGAGFDYLLRTAIRESSLEPAAKAASSSAVGLFQFVEQTWLGLVKEAGPIHGMAGYADAISQSGNRYEVADPGLRREILALRADPRIASVMAGELASRNSLELESDLGRPPTAGELYIGHFLGPQAAGQLIRTAAEAPATPAADQFPAAADANPAIFFDRSGARRTSIEVYSLLVRSHDGSPSSLAGAGRRESVTPFAGITAFFDRFFSAPRAESSSEAGSSDRTQSSWRYAPDANAARAAEPDVLQAARAYENRARPKIRHDPVGTDLNWTRQPQTAAPGSWSNSLFANAARPDGPLVLPSAARRN